MICLKSAKNSNSICSTWNILLVTVLLTASDLLVSCEKKDPKPELRDNIYQDMVAQQAEAERLSKEADEKIEEVKKSARGSAPQSGLQQKANRQVVQFQKLKEKMAQQLLYWKLRSFERLKYVRLKSIKQPDGYRPDPQEWEVYNSEKKLRMAKNAWDLKGRFKETGFDYDPALMGENPADAPKKPAPPPASGHH